MNENADFVKLIFSVKADNWLPHGTFTVNHYVYDETYKCPFHPEKHAGVLDWTPED